MLDSIFKGSCIEEDPPSLGDTLLPQKRPLAREMTAKPRVLTVPSPAPAQSVAAGAALSPHCATWGSSLKIDGISCPGGGKKTQPKKKKPKSSPAEPVPGPCTLPGMLTASACQPARLLVLLQHLQRAQGICLPLASSCPCSIAGRARDQGLCPSAAVGSLPEGHGSIRAAS